MIKTLSPFISIIRLANVLMTGFAVFLGAWLSGTLSAAVPVMLLMTAAMSAAGYGNVINDLLDMETDRISHPRRPLVNGSLGTGAASAFAVLLIIISFLSAGLVSFFHWKATLIPLLLLSAYSFYFKRTPIFGNLVVASLVAYALLFGALPRPEYKILLVPALLAFLLNFCREVAKDVQDEKGDRTAGYSTTAALPPSLLRRILLLTGAIYLILFLLPSLLLNHFGAVYTIVCVLIVMPLHIYWAALVWKPDFSLRADRISLILKYEMLAGLFALAMDKIVQIPML